MEVFCASRKLPTRCESSAPRQWRAVRHTSLHSSFLRQQKTANVLRKQRAASVARREAYFPAQQFSASADNCQSAAKAARLYMMDFDLERAVEPVVNHHANARDRGPIKRFRWRVGRAAGSADRDNTTKAERATITRLKPNVVKT